MSQFDETTERVAEELAYISTPFGQVLNREKRSGVVVGRNSAKASLKLACSYLEEHAKIGCQLAQDFKDEIMKDGNWPLEEK